MFSRVYLCLLLLPMFNNVYLCLPMFTRVNICDPILDNGAYCGIYDFELEHTKDEKVTLCRNTFYCINMFYKETPFVRYQNQPRKLLHCQEVAISKYCLFCARCTSHGIQHGNVRVVSRQHCN